jgi:hypothetical protein
MMTRSPYWNLPKEELANKLAGANPDSIAAQQIMAILQVRILQESFKSLIDSQNMLAAASQRMERRIFWLTVIIAVGTLAAPVIDVITLLLEAN